MRPAEEEPEARGGRLGLGMEHNLWAMVGRRQRKRALRRLRCDNFLCAGNPNDAGSCGRRSDE